METSRPKNIPPTDCTKRLKFTIILILSFYGVAVEAREDSIKIHTIEPLVVKSRNFSNKEIIQTLDNFDIVWQQSYAGVLPVLSPNAKYLLENMNWKTMHLLSEKLKDKNCALVSHVLLNYGMEILADEDTRFKKNFNIIMPKGHSENKTNIDDLMHENILQFWSVWTDKIKRLSEK